MAGEINFRTIAEAVGQATNCPTKSITYAEAVELWGPPWVEIGLAVNSRLRAPKTRSELGWRPAHVDLITDIREGSYKNAFEEAKSTNNLQGYAWSAHGQQGM